MVRTMCRRVDLDYIAFQKRLIPLWAKVAEERVFMVPMLVIHNRDITDRQPCSQLF